MLNSGKKIKKGKDKSALLEDASEFCEFTKIMNSSMSLITENLYIWCYGEKKGKRKRESRSALLEDTPDFCGFTKIMNSSTSLRILN